MEFYNLFDNAILIDVLNKEIEYTIRIVETLPHSIIETCNLFKSLTVLQVVGNYFMDKKNIWNVYNRHKIDMYTCIHDILCSITQIAEIPKQYSELCKFKELTHLLQRLNIIINVMETIDKKGIPKAKKCEPSNDIVFITDTN